VTLAGIVIQVDAGWLSVTTAPAAGAILESMTLPLTLEPPLTLPGYIVTDWTVGMGSMVNVDVSVTPAYAAEIVDGVAAETALLVIVNVALELPEGTETLAGTTAFAFVLLSAIVTADVVCLLNDMVPVDGSPPTIIVGLSERYDSKGTTLSEVVCVTPAYVADIVAELELVTGWAVTVNVALCAPAATVTVAGTVATLTALLDRAIVTPPVGASVLRFTVPVDVPPPSTV
jgi:hypothetical protein